MKRGISFIIIAALCFNTSVSYAKSSEEPLNVELKESGYYLDVYDGYRYHMDGAMWNNYFLNDHCFGYVLFQQDVEDGVFPGFEGAMTAATNLLSGVSLLDATTWNGPFDPDDAIVEYYEIALTSFLKTIEDDFSESLMKQTDADSTMGAYDYILKNFDMTLSFASSWIGTEKNPNFKTVLQTQALDYCGIVTDKLDSSFRSEKNTQAKLLEADKYVRFELLLNAITQNTDNLLLRKAAHNVDNALDYGFAYKINLLDISEDVTKVLSTPLFGIMDLIILEEEAANKLTLPNPKEMKGFLVMKLMSNANQLYQAADAGKKAGIFLSDLLIGGSNIFLRYYELLGMAEVRDSLIRQIEKNNSNIQGADNFYAIKENCDLLKLLIAVNLRGDHCMHSLLTKDANLHSTIKNHEQNSIKLTRNDGTVMTFDEWYDQTVRVARGYYTIIEGIIPNPDAYIRENKDSYDLTDVYKEFLQTNGYAPYIWNWWSGGLAHYTMLDIDQNGLDELILSSDEDSGFCNFSIFGYNTDTNTVFNIPFINEDETENDDNNYSQYHMGLYYSPQHQALVYTETRNNPSFSGHGFWKLKDGNMNLDFSTTSEINHDTYQYSYFIYDGNEKFEIDEQDYQELMQNNTLVEFTSVADTLQIMLQEYYKNDPSEPTVQEGSIIQGIYFKCQVRCGLPGNPEASQPLYEITVHIPTGTVTEHNVITESDKTFNLY